MEILETASAGANNAQLTAFLEELEVKMPTEILALSASCDEVGVSMNIETTSMEAVALTLSQLRTFESIDSLSISAISEDTDDLGFVRVSFSLSCFYKPVPVPVEPGTTEVISEEGDFA